MVFILRAWGSSSGAGITISTEDVRAVSRTKVGILIVASYICPVTIAECPYDVAATPLVFTRHVDSRAAHFLSVGPK